SASGLHADRDARRSVQRYGRRVSWNDPRGRYDAVPCWIMPRNHSDREMGSSVHWRGELTDQFRHDVRGTGIVDLACSRRHMPAAPVHKAKRTDVDGRASVDDRLADSKYGVLLLDAPKYMHRDP